MTFFVNFFVAAVLMGTTLMYGTLGEILTEKVGNMNLGVEGLIYMGGSTGLIAAFLYERAVGDSAIPMVAVVLAFLAAFLAAGSGKPALFLSDHHPSYQSECHRFGADYLWRGVRRVLRRVFSGHWRRSASDFRSGGRDLLSATAAAVSPGYSGGWGSCFFPIIL